MSAQAHEERHESYVSGCAECWEEALEGAAQGVRWACPGGVLREVARFPGMVVWRLVYVEEGDLRIYVAYREGRGDSEVIFAENAQERLDAEIRSLEERREEAARAAARWHKLETAGAETAELSRYGRFSYAIQQLREWELKA